MAEHFLLKEKPFKRKLRLFVFALSSIIGLSCYSMPFDFSEMLNVTSSESNAAESESTEDSNNSPQSLNRSRKPRLKSPRLFAKVFVPTEWIQFSCFKKATKSPWFTRSFCVSSPKAGRTLPLLIWLVNFPPKNFPAKSFWTQESESLNPIPAAHRRGLMSLTHLTNL